MAIYVPTIQTEHVKLGLISSSDPKVAVDNKAFNELRGSGVVEFEADGLANLKQGGDLINVPALVEPADFIRVDHTSNTEMTPEGIDTKTDVAVTQYNKQVYEFKESDRIRTGHDADAEYSLKIGGKVAKRGFITLMKTAIGALQAVDTPSANCHILDVFSGTMGAEVYPSLDLIRQTKNLLGDAAMRLNTAVMHSASFQWIVKDLLENFNAGSVIGDSVARSSMLGTLLGISQWIVSDDIPTLSGGANNQAKYPILLFGPGALWFGYQAEPKVERDNNILLPSTKEYLAVSFVSVSHLRFVKSVSTGNPGDDDLIDPTKWDEAYDDHRRVLAAMLLTNGIPEAE